MCPDLNIGVALEAHEDAGILIDMIQENVQLTVNGRSFMAEAQVNVDKLDDQLELDGRFILSALPDAEQLVAEYAIHSDGHTSSHVFRLLKTQKSYRFKMNSSTSFEFTAVRSDVNPATGKPAFER
jgi:hypothetical protein